jgi:hypothetical protein
MRPLLLLFGLLTACAKHPHTTVLPARLSACPVQVVAYPPNLALLNTNQAVQAFDQLPNTAYAVLYIREVAGFTGSNRYLLVRQQAATQFVVYQYGAQRIYSTAVTDTTWQRTLTQLRATAAHFYSACLRTTDPSLEFLVVKHRRKIVFSLTWETYRHDPLPTAEQARLGPALTLMRRLRD